MSSPVISGWHKMSSDLDSNPKIRRAGRLGREVFQFALRRNAAPSRPGNGTIPRADLEPWFIADQLMMPEAEASEGLARAIKAGLIAPAGDSYTICGWDDEWGRRAMTAAERKALQRARERPPSADVTHVTADRDCHTSEETEEIEEKEEGAARARAIPAPEPAPRPTPPRVATPMSDGWKPDETEENQRAADAARDRDVNVTVAVTSFVADKIAKGIVRVDWNAEWRKWLAVEFPGKGAPPAQPRAGRAPPKSAPAINHEARRIADERERAAAPIQDLLTELANNPFYRKAKTA